MIRDVIIGFAPPRAETTVGSGGVYNRSDGRIVVLWIKCLGLEVIEILTRVCSLIIEELDDSEERGGKEGSQSRPKPIDPVVPVEFMKNNIGSEGSSWVERTTGIVDP
jgi:hypothetical protein